MALFYYRDPMRDPKLWYIMTTAVGQDAVNELRAIADRLPSNTKEIVNEDVGLRMALPVSKPWALPTVMAMGCKQIGTSEAYKLHERLAQRWALDTLNIAIFRYRPPDPRTRRYLFDLADEGTFRFFDKICRLSRSARGNVNEINANRDRPSKTRRQAFKKWYEKKKAEGHLSYVDRVLKDDAPPVTNRRSIDRTHPQQGPAPYPYEDPSDEPDFQDRDPE